MTTPFASFKNCVISFNVPTGNTTTDDFGVSQKTLTKLEVTAFLNQKKKPMADQISGANQEAIYVEGKCISPKTVPNSIAPETVHPVRFDDGREFEFHYQQSIPSSFYDENNILGQKLTGYITTTNVWGQGS